MKFRHIAQLVYAPAWANCWKKSLVVNLPHTWRYMTYYTTRCMVLPLVSPQ